MENFLADRPETFAASRKQQIEKYKTSDHPQRREVIEAELEKFIENNWPMVAERLFLIKDSADLTEEEVADLQNFIRHAGKRLVVDRFHSPLFALPETATAENAITEGGGLFIHDLTHTIAAFDREGGKDMTPEFMKHSGEAQYTDPDALQEEVFANLFGETQLGNIFLVAEGREADNFLLILDEREESLKSNEWMDEARRDRLYQIYGEMRAAVQSVDKSSVETILDTYETLVGNVLQLSLVEDSDENPNQPFPADAEREARIQKVMASAKVMRHNSRFPGYETVAKNIPEHKDDKKIHFKEMQRVMGPLLERLRRKDDYRAEAAASLAEDSDEADVLREQLRQDMPE